MKMGKWIAMLLAFLIIFSATAVLWTVTALGATPTYTVSSQYSKSKYYDNFKKVPLTGDMATDTVAIALSQLGYHEGNSDADLGGLNVNGTRDFVEYNVLYGKLDNDQGNGVSYGYYWCASFINWCLRQARVSKDASAAAEVSCQRWLTACKSAGIYMEKTGYAPKRGDLIFFKDSGSYVSSTHMGIVLYSDGTRVYTVEGNTSNGSFSSNGNYVAIKSYSLSSTYIVGYACPKYETDDSVIEVDYSGEHMSTGLYVSTKEISCYGNSEMKGESEKLEAYVVFSVKEICSNTFRIVYERDGEEIEAWADISGKAQQMTADSVAYTVSYLDENNASLLPKQFRLADTKITVSEERPVKKNAGFLGWSFKKGEKTELIAPGEVIAAGAEDVVLYAVWDYTFYLVTFKDSDGSVISQKYGYFGDTYEIPVPDHIPEGYVFVGWDSRAADGVIRGDASYTAVYRVRTESDTETASADGEQTDGQFIPVIGGGSDAGCRAGIGTPMILLIAAACGFAVTLMKKKES
ncbi:MAG: InlB B-repeat-containing protein [Clostridia bacterium]|nr:InlB B-repeat-containing protein [Clostridia bacterium]